MKNKVVAIVGPTATGKTEIAVDIAKKLNGAIVNLDSVQIYKMADIGSAKPSKKIIEIIPHYLIDQFEPNEKVDMKRIIEIATEIGKKIIDENKLPIYVGGTGLYFKALFYGIFDGPSKNQEIRDRLKKIKEEKGSKYLYQELQKVDPETASRISENDYIRIERALEVYYTTGKTISYLQKNQKKEIEFDFIKIGLNIDRKELYERIEKRVDKMIEDGLIEETKNILKKYPDSMVIQTAIGYKEVKDFLDNKIDYEKMVYLIKRNTRRFAKRQLTLFRAIDGIKWFKPSDVDNIIDFIRKKLSEN
ncbi:MAG TPA: tRNA (adenosine(37)-N6)-dimethylallyltransferase MiaA [Spirochaetota bacterium]|nr:tRNA (adenosine(37)-N6)-dimethylallyltransferase MiaA [Spirochaetota bacterium]HOM38714.1 tRNA (adenosine(37)-N6)-dimethylallyltransferase MiaA [Spirochaetota bacterium]HPQ49511.1 tRNA (adenosine(37)-N6)-dimethylallyltransferase MiaA [Spirochaetota bacterium]